MSGKEYDMEFTREQIEKIAGGLDPAYIFSGHDHEEVITILAKMVLRRLWHPYPDDKPRVDGRYLVTTIAGLTEIRYYSVDCGWSYDYFNSVIAWMEIPLAVESEER